MGLRRSYYIFKNSVGVHWKLNRRIFVWLGVFVLAGIVIGFITIFNSKFIVANVSKNLLDINILRVIKQSSFGSIIFNRIFDFILMFVFIFIISLHRWTVLFVFPYIALRSCLIVVNLYWIIMRIGIMTGFILFIVYVFWLLILLGLAIGVVIYCLRSCYEIRCGGFRGGMKWRDFWKSTMVFMCLITVFALFEWLVYWLVLSKIIFLV